MTYLGSMSCASVRPRCAAHAFNMWAWLVEVIPNAGSANDWAELDCMVASDLPADMFKVGAPDIDGVGRGLVDGGAPAKDVLDDGAG